MSLAKIQKQYETTILEGMARSLWVMAFAQWSEEQQECRYCHQPIESSGEDMWQLVDAEGVDPETCPYGEGWHEPPAHHVVARGGEDWDNISPETPHAAMRAAKDLVRLIASGEDLVGDTAPMTTLFALAYEVDKGEPFEYAEKVSGRASEDARRDKNDKFTLAERFGGDIAMQSLGTGAGWGDNHKTKRGNAVFDPKLPWFECTYNGEQLEWSGRLREGDERASGHGTAGPRRITVTTRDPSSAEDVDVIDDVVTGATNPGRVASDVINVLTEQAAATVAARRQDQAFYGPPRPEGVAGDVPPMRWKWHPGQQYLRTASAPNGEFFSRTYRLENFTPEEEQQIFERIAGHIGTITLVNPQDDWEHNFLIYMDGLALYVNASALEDAFDELGGWAEDNAPGLLMDEQHREAYDEALRDMLNKRGFPDESLLSESDMEKVHASADEGLLGVDGGHYFENIDWGAVIEDPSREELLERGGVSYPVENPRKGRTIDRSQRTRGFLR